MANRMIPFGYIVTNGVIVADDTEADIVRRVFKEYIAGKLLREIAEELTTEGISFYEGCCQWNKNKIARIIEDGRYIGERNYPAIIDIAVFESANGKKDGKGFEKDKSSAIVEYLKRYLFCGQCGARLIKHDKEQTRGRWECKCGCAYRITISDIVGALYTLFGDIKSGRESIEPPLLESTYTKTQEIVRQTNDINRFMNERLPSFNTGKRMILESAATKFSACVENKGAAYTDYIHEQIADTPDDEYLTEGFLRTIIAKLKIDGNMLTIVFINGAEVVKKIAEDKKCKRKNKQEK